MAVKTYQMGMDRETEALTFFRNNKIATPARISTITNTGATKQPTVVTEYFDDRGIGKIDRIPQKSAYVANSTTVS